ncbi:MAG: hypothetical protein ABI114_12225 [Rhodanobacter sp.]
MTRSSRQRLTLLLAVAALLALALWQHQRDVHNETGNLTTLDPASIQHVALTLPNTPTLHYERRSGHWWRSDGTPKRANDARVNELTAAAAAPVLSWRPASDFDAAKIGLAPPQATLELDGQRLEFGELSVTGPQYYVRVGARIALVSARYMPRSPAVAVTELH